MKRKYCLRNYNEKSGFPAELPGGFRRPTVHKTDGIRLCDGNMEGIGGCFTYFSSVFTKILQFNHPLLLINRFLVI